MKKTVLALIGLSALLAAHTALAAYSVGDTVADFTLNDSEGNPVSLYQYVGKVVWLNIYQTT